MAAGLNPISVGRHRPRRPPRRRRRPRARRGLPVAEPDALADRARERRDRRRPGLPEGDARRAPGGRRILPREGRPRRRDGPPRRRDVERHAPARRHRPRLRALAEAAAARRAVRHARQPDPLGAAGGADGGLVADPRHRDLRHPRRRRGDPALRPRGDDDQRPRGHHRPASSRSTCPARAPARRWSSTPTTTATAPPCSSSSRRTSTAPTRGRKSPDGLRHAEAEARGHRRRHGLGPRARAPVRGRPRPLRGHALQRRAARQLQPPDALAGALRREDLRRDRHPRRRLVRGERRRDPLRRGGDQDRPRPPGRRHQGRRDPLRQAADRHRLRALHPAAAGQGPRGRDRLTATSTTSSRMLDAAALPRAQGGGDRRRPARPRGRRRPRACAAWRSWSCTSWAT